MPACILAACSSGASPSSSSATATPPHPQAPQPSVPASLPPQTGPGSLDIVLTGAATAHITTAFSPLSCSDLLPPGPGPGSRATSIAADASLPVPTRQLVVAATVVSPDDQLYSVSLAVRGFHGPDTYSVADSVTVSVATATGDHTLVAGPNGGGGGGRLVVTGDPAAHAMLSADLRPASGAGTAAHVEASFGCPMATSADPAGTAPQPPSTLSPTASGDAGASSAQSTGRRGPRPQPSGRGTTTSSLSSTST